jgi:hypothetical protein
MKREKKKGLGKKEQEIYIENTRKVKKKDRKR